MQDKLLILVLFFSPMSAFTQNYPSADSANKLIMNGGDCSDRTFTKMEKPPSLRVSNEQYADSLGAYLKSHQGFLKNRTVDVSFVVTCHGEISSLAYNTGDLTSKDVVEKAILFYSGLWMPGKQNGYIINAFMSLKLKFGKDSMTIEISQ